MSEIAKKVRVVSLDVDVVEFDELIGRIDSLRQNGGGYVCFSTVHMVMEAHDDPEYAAKVNAADIIVPDGMPLVWMQKIEGRRDANRVRANDLMIGLCEFARANGHTVGFYGAKDEVIEAIRKRIERDLPGLKVAYAFSPPFRPLTDDEDTEITAEIATKAPDLLFVGLGCPKQERWMNAHRPRLKSVMLGVGASFDFFAGNVAECPPWIGRLGLEWLFRLTQEPRRLWKRYLVLNPRFVVQAGLQALKRRK
ncbi:MAG: WecB/TagA/CpsF family glycosyl transferase [Acidobacteria bacterium OLB17]|nr:MAG: WecB/TagA/CpsF family glycosyl transferase [Acidobacteria bacterium OLB17]MCZ2390387.1 WecB/TagA/CpsF family glycosyltransferase [Acidobacteriota bacterium]